MVTNSSDIQQPTDGPDPRPTTYTTDGGEGRIRTFEAPGATDLQSVAFDRFATSPVMLDAGRACHTPMPPDAARLFVPTGLTLAPEISQTANRRPTCQLLELAEGLEPPTR